MGYRSEVAYKIKFGKKDDFWGFIAESKLDPDTELCFSEDEKPYFEVVEDKYEIRFYCDSVKWYEEYDEVKAHHALFDKAKERNDDLNVEVDGAFCRIGEESDDVEERYFGNDAWDMVRVTRGIEIDWEA
jgi:hypothetical protein